MTKPPPPLPHHDHNYLYSSRKCLGGCGREIDQRLFACSHCLDRLPENVRDPIVQRSSGLAVAVARARIYFENTTHISSGAENRTA